jgi:hypothetical protein
VIALRNRGVAARPPTDAGEEGEQA